MTWALPNVSGMTPQLSGVASLSSKQILAGARLLSQHSTAVRPVTHRCLAVRALAGRGHSDNGYGYSQGFHSSAGYRQVSTSASTSVSCCFPRPSPFTTSHLFCTNICLNRCAPMVGWCFVTLFLMKQMTTNSCHCATNATVQPTSYTLNSSTFTHAACAHALVNGLCCSLTDDRSLLRLLKLK